MVDEFYDHQDVWLYEEDAVEQKIKLHPNEFVMMVSVENEKKTAIARFHSWNKPLTHPFNNEGRHFLMGCQTKKQRTEVWLGFAHEPPCTACEPHWTCW